MKLILKLELDNAAFEDNFSGELQRILTTVAHKIERIRDRAPGCICEAPEADDKLLDSNGNTVGTITLKD